MKNGTIKKLLGLVITLTLAACGLTGCGSQKTESSESQVSDQVSSESSAVTETSESVEPELEPVTLKWYYNGTEGEGTEDVIEVFNKKLQEVLPNTTVEFVFDGDYATNWSMYMAAQEKIDIAWAGYDTSWMKNAQDGNFTVLTDLVNEELAPNLVAEMEIWTDSYASCSYNNELYAIPNIQPTVDEATAWRILPELEPYLDVEALMEDFHTTTKATAKQFDLLEEAIKKAIEDDAFSAYPGWKIDTTIVQWGFRGYLSPASNIYIDPELEDPEVLHVCELPEFKMAVEYVAKWYDEGLITDSQLLGQLPEGTATIIAISNKQTWAGANEIGVKDFGVDSSDKYEKLLLLTNKPEQGYIGNVSKNPTASLVIPYTSENPERAIMLINLLHDEVGTPGNDLLNLLCYGFEKSSEEAKEYGWYNYEAVEEDGQLMVDTSVRGDAPSMHSMTNWKIGNTYKVMHDGGSLTTTANKERAMQFYTEVYPNRIKSVIAGWKVPDLDESVSVQYENMTAIYKEYKDQLYNGCGGTDKVDDLFETVLNKLKDAGLEDVREWYKNQIDAYSSSNK